MTDPTPNRPGVGTSRSDRARATERRLAIALVVVTLLFALVVQTLFFHFSELMGGDVNYHRGVALTMTARMWQGEGPIHGVISYFGGLYPFTLGWLSHVLGVSFDKVLSVVSWPFALALPLVLLALGRSIWPRRTLEPALLAFVGTVGSSLGMDLHAEWVFSALPSGANEWPAYPRDVALVLMIGALAVVLRPLTWWRVLGAGMLVAAAIATQAQIGVYALAVVVLVGAVTTVARRGWRGIAMPIGIGVVGLAAAAVWWAPRLVAALDSRTLLLASFPTLPLPDGSPLGLLNAFGATGVLALGGILLAWRRSLVERFFALWLLVLLPVIVFGGPLSDLGFITLRRAWFLAGVPMVVCATIAAVALVRWAPRVPALIVLVLVLAIPATIEALDTRELVTAQWRAPDAATAYGSDQWAAAQASLRSRTVDAHGLVVLAPDLDAAWIWRNTGAQPFSLWLNGSTKLGFDPAALTPWGYLDRVHMQDRAFRRGLPGLCALAARTGASRIVLRHNGDQLGTHDRRPAAVYRVGPQRRTLASLDRRVAPGVRYLDENSTDALQLEPNATVPIGWTSRSVRTLQVDYLRGAPPDVLVLETPDGTVIRPTASTPLGATFTVDGVKSGTVIRAVAPATVVRTIGFEPSPVPLPANTGVVDLAVATVCR